MEFASAFGQDIAITAMTIESFPVFPTRLLNQMVWVHASMPMTEMSNLRVHWPAIFISSVFIGKRFMKQLDRHFMTFESCRAVFSFLTVIRVRENAAIFIHKETFFTDCSKSIYVLRTFVAFLFDLVRPV